MELAPNQRDIFKALTAFMVSVLPPGIPVQQGQQNRVAEPEFDDFVLMWPIALPRLGMNFDNYFDLLFNGSIVSRTLTVTKVVNGAGKIAIGSAIFGVGLRDGLIVSSLGPGGTGGVGQYLLNQPLDISLQAMASGTRQVIQPADCHIQVDVHGPNGLANAQLITTLFRDFYGVEFFQEFTGSSSIVPLYTEDPKQIPFVNAEQQYEYRYVIDLHLEVNQTVILPQQFADVLSTTINFISTEELSS